MRVHPKLLPSMQALSRRVQRQALTRARRPASDHRQAEPSSIDGCLNDPDVVAVRVHDREHPRNRALAARTSAAPHHPADREGGQPAGRRQHVTNECVVVDEA